MSSRLSSLIAVGSYAESGGLTTWRWDGARGFEPAGSADIAAPSFVCWHPAAPILYAVSEQDQGQVTAFAVSEDGELEALASIDTGGPTPCWVTSDPVGSALLVANYDEIDAGIAGFTTIRLGADGLFTGGVTVQRQPGSGPDTERQRTGHIHQVVPTPYGSVLATDLGADAIWEYQVDADAVVAIGRIALPAGSGPRHMALSSDGSTGFVVGELDATITVIRRAAGGGWFVVKQVPSAGESEVPRNRIYPSHVVLCGRDRYLLVANRGTNTLAVMDVADDLKIVEEVPVGTWPRHFALIGDTILLAAQQDDAVEVYLFDDRTGAIRPLGGEDVATLSVTSPSCASAHPLR